MKRVMVIKRQGIPVDQSVLDENNGKFLRIVNGEIKTETATISEVDPLSLHLDQTTPQTVSGGAPVFENGLVIKAGQKLVLDG